MSHQTTSYAESNESMTIERTIAETRTEDKNNNLSPTVSLKTFVKT